MKAKYIVIIAVVIVVVAVGIAIAALWSRMQTSCVDETTDAYVPTGADYGELLGLLDEGGQIKDITRFDKAARFYKLDEGVRPGHYVLRPNMSYVESVKMFRGGAQTPVRLTFNNIRTLPQLAGRLAQQVEPDSTAILAVLESPEVAASYGFEPRSFIGMFIPNTYEVWWTTTPEALIERMKKEYDRFWDEERTAKLEKTGLTREQAVTLASIVYEESKMSDEMPLVAGVYMNRLDRGMLLQADPTVKFAVGDFTLRRILHRHLEIDSQYNTYKYAGLPPGPICMPSVKAIDAVLDYRKHNYLYFCAKPDFSGYHNFAVTLAEHNRNAQAYYAFLNREGIK